MKIMGFEQGAVTVKLNAAECQALAEALASDHNRDRRPLSEAFRVCARVASAQNRQALTVRVVRAPVASFRQARAIVTVD